MKVFDVLVVALGFLFGSASAFVQRPWSPKTTTTSLAAAMDRRHFAEAATAAVLVVGGRSLPAWALEDLGELTPEEKEAAEVRLTSVQVRGDEK